MSKGFSLDNVAIPDESLTVMSLYYQEYVKFGGKRTYQEYIQLCERHLDPKKELLPRWMSENMAQFCMMADWSNKHWRVQSGSPEKKDE